jgi:hypothetical protein
MLIFDPIDKRGAVGEVSGDTGIWSNVKRKNDLMGEKGSDDGKTTMRVILRQLTTRFIMLVTSTAYGFYHVVEINYDMFEQVTENSSV